MSSRCCAQAKRAAKEIGEVTVDMGDTACVVRVATESIAKAEKSGRVGKTKNDSLLDFNSHRECRALFGDLGL